jgi:hypothetical protein
MQPGSNQGTKNFRAKLTESDVREIYLDRTRTQHDLAVQYGVRQSTINHIKRGRTWRWLTESLKENLAS